MTRMPAFPPGPCAETDAEIFFPEVHIVSPAAKALCRSCESRLPCLEWALANYEQGIWGGISERGRDAVRRQLRAGHSLEDIVAVDDTKFYAQLEKAQASALAAVARKRSRARELDRERAALRRAA